MVSQILSSFVSSAKSGVSSFVVQFVKSGRQPVDDVVPRPPLRSLIAGGTFLLWLLTTSVVVLFILVVSYPSSQITVSTAYQSGGETADRLQSGCREITQYPVTLNIPMEGPNHFQVTLLGPKYHDHQALTKMLMSMHCRLEPSSGEHLFYAIHGDGSVQSNPVDYRRNCLARFPEASDVQMQLSPESGPSRFLSLYQALGAVRRLRTSGPPDYIVVALRVSRVRFNRATGYEAEARFQLALTDGRQYRVLFSMSCKNRAPMTQKIIRDCSAGAPFLRLGARADSTAFPDLCPLNSSDPGVISMTKSLHRDLSHPFMISAVNGWNQTFQQGDAIPQLRAPLNRFCQREWRDLVGLLRNQKTYLSSEQVVTQVAKRISEKRVYHVSCDRKVFAGMLSCLAFAWPLLTLWMTMSCRIIPFIYKCADARTKVGTTDLTTVVGMCSPRACNPEDMALDRASHQVASPAVVALVRTLVDTAVSEQVKQISVDLCREQTKSPSFQQESEISLDRTIASFDSQDRSTSMDSTSRHHLDISLSTTIVTDDTNRAPPSSSCLGHGMTTSSRIPYGEEEEALESGLITPTFEKERTFL